MDTTQPPQEAKPDRRKAGAKERKSSGARGSGTRSAETRGRGEAEAQDVEVRAAGSPGPWDHESESFGAWLSRHRRVRGIELREIAEDSKIGMTYLQAFEDDRFDILPAAVFAKGFLRQYANYVGLDPEEVVNFYLSAAQQNQDRGEESLEPPAENPRADPLKLAVLAVVAVLALLAVIWFWTTGKDDERSPEEPVTSMETGAATESSTEAAAASGEEPAASVATQASLLAAEPVDTSPLRLTLDFSGECWVEVSVDGDRQIAENKIQGESLVLRAEQVIDLKVGNVDMVEAELNGRPFRFDNVRGTKVRTQRIDLETVVGSSGPGQENP